MCERNLSLDSLTGDKLSAVMNIINVIEVFSGAMWNIQELAWVT
jgi:hypothetical protein